MPRWKERTDFERALEKTSFGFGENACWNWIGALQKDGYGSLGIRKGGKWRMVLAHRFMYEEQYGEIPKGMCICHSCDNPACVNPEHLFMGTHQDNMRDRSNKGRVPDMRGENNPKAKLSNEQVATMRKDYSWGYTTGKLARKFNMTPENVWSIVNHETWTHI